MDKLDMFNRLRGREKAPAYPDVPGSLRSQSIELDDLRKVQVTRANTAPDVTPYLSLRSRLSQIWLNRWTILLLLVLVRVMIAVAGLDDDIGEAKIKALQACTKVEDIGSAMSSMPHYLSLGVNELSASGIERAVRGLVSALQLAVTIIENLIIFVINMMVSTYVCLATAIIHGTLDVASDVVEKFTKAMNGAISTIADGISNDAKSIQDKINDLTGSIEDSVFGPILPNIPDVDFTSALDKLKNLNIDTSGFVSDIDTLNDNIPTFDEVKNLTESAISIPFNLIKKEINESLAGFSFDRDVFPVAQKQQLTFCSDNDNINSFFNDLYGTVKSARIGFITVIVILAILAMIPMGWLEIKRWRRQQAHARIVETNQYDSMDVVYIASRPVTATWGIKFASRFQGNRQVLVRWCIAYATSLPAIFVLSLAIAGFFSCLCQIIVLRAVQHKVPELANQVGDFAEDVVTSLQGVSKQWANDANSVIINFNDELNSDVLGFVTEGTSAVNNTLNTFTAQMEKGIDAIFGDTVLKKVAEDLIRCVIGLKIEAVQKGLTWLHEQAHVEFPLFSEDTFSLGAQESISGDSDLTTFLASPSSVTTDEVTGAVEKVVNALEKGIIIEACISTGLLFLYVIVVLMGVIRTLIGMATPDRTRGEGGAAPTTGPSHDRDAYGEGFDDYYTKAPATASNTGSNSAEAYMTGGQVAARGYQRRPENPFASEKDNQF
ncbi:hypothetical protein jhhlp_000449 [Lomentospora prolificans]|uniref:Plasma membrane fusion protein PRM1 n=1 Tax=Lomentospora prolificans TaxID=41688 RepID=A0A2N3NKZ0_9PEZI|nr:hypothetical protein jhhlp_000449 [Lomentospora prolificans]